jgi:hypothetical protein
MKKIILFFLFISCTAFGQQEAVPLTENSVMIDGRFHESEWRGAKSIDVNDSLTLYFQQDVENIYWCVRGKFKTPKLTSIDFYITSAVGLMNLHASAKLGQRQIQTTIEYGEWNWWNNQQWIANVVRPDNWEKRTFLNDESKEFQVRKNLFVNRSVSLMFTIEYPKELVTRFPVGSKNDDPKEWLKLSW